MYFTLRRAILKNGTYISKELFCTKVVVAYCSLNENLRLECTARLVLEEWGS